MAQLNSEILGMLRREGLLNRDEKLEAGSSKRFEGGGVPDTYSSPSLSKRHCSGPPFCYMVATELL